MKFQTIDAKAHDTFVKKSPLNHLLQSSTWAKVKENWTSEILGVVDDEGEILASALVLIKKLPLGFTLFYTPRGPIMDYQNATVVKFFFAQLKQYAKQKRALFIKFDPAVIYRTSKFNQKMPTEISEETLSILDNIKATGAVHVGFTQKMCETIQPRFQANIYKKNFSEEQLPKSAKKMLKQAHKKGVVVRQGHKELVVDFSEVIRMTTERQHISLRNAEYFKKLLENYPEQSFILLAEVDLKTRYEKIKLQYDKNKQELVNLKENQLKKRHNLEELDFSLTRELEELDKSMKKSGNKAVIAGALAITFGSASEILYAGMDERYKRYMPAYLAWFETINESFKRGCETSNMGGVEGDLADGLSKFKSNFNPDIQELIGEFNLPVNRLLYRLGNVAYQIRKKRGRK